jgi:hypothetical protein
VYAADLISTKHKLEHKNRFALILLDSCLEIAFRDYLAHVKNIKFDRKQFTRAALIDAMKKNSQIPDDMWKSIDYFYELRCSLIHELATPEIIESDIEDFREIVSTVLFALHGLAV